MKRLWSLLELPAPKPHTEAGLVSGLLKHVWVDALTDDMLKHAMMARHAAPEELVERRLLDETDVFDGALVLALEDEFEDDAEIQQQLQDPNEKKRNAAIKMNRSCS